MSTTKKLTKVFLDAIPQGPHPTPHSEWISVRLDFIQETIDHLDWLEKGNAEWRSEYMRSAKQARVAGATADVAIAHLDKVLNQCRTADSQQKADTEARDWLASIGA